MGPGRLSPQANGIQPHGQAKTYGQISNQYFLSTVLNSGIRSQYLKKKETTAWQANNKRDYSQPANKAIDQSSPWKADLLYSHTERQTEKEEKNER